MTTPIEKVLSRLANKRQSSNGWTARCPAHEDKRNSLSIGVGDDGRLLLRCFTGCHVEDIVQALGLEMKDLFPTPGDGGAHIPCNKRSTAQHADCTLARYSAAKRLPVEFLRSLGLTDMSYMGKPALRIPYFNRNGEVVAVRIRIGMEGDKFRWRRNDKSCLYGLNRLSGETSYIVLVEGESDCHTLWSHGIPALGIPGAAIWNEARDAWLLDGFETIFVVREPDSGGTAIEAWLERSRIRDRVRLVTLGAYKDPSALHIFDLEQFETRWQKAIETAIPWVEQCQKKVTQLRNRGWSKCSSLATSDDILKLFYESFRQLAVGEERAAKLIYLALVSRLLNHIVSLVVKGPSSGGKSYLVECALKFFPERSYYALTAMSNKAIAYSEEPLKHRFIVIYEATGAESECASYLLRSLLSEGKIRYEFVEKTKDGLKPKLIEREGPTGLIVTTTSARLHPENETRLFSLTINDTKEQTKAILRALAREDSCSPDLEPWHALQEWLEAGPREVTIPFASILAEIIPPAAVRLRRDFSAVLNLIRAHALLHQKNRERDDNKRIVASIADYAEVRALVADLVAEGVEATVSPVVRETVLAVTKLIDSGKDSVSLSDLVNELNLDRSAISRRVSTAKSKGYLKDLESKRGRPSKLVINDPMPDDHPILPPVEDLVLQCCRSNVRDSQPAPPASKPVGPFDRSDA